MKNKKRRFETLSFYDHTGIEKHLTEMARKGWMIERISNSFWTYRKIEPQELYFTVSYYPKASDFDPVPTEGQQTLLDLCAETGWELACTWFQMQIFYHSGGDPVPIHTDPMLEVESIHRACKANYLRGYWLLLIIGAIGSFLFCSSLISDTLRIMASPGDFFSGICVVMLFLLCGAELVSYYVWHKRAKKAALQEQFMDTPSTAKFQKFIMAVLAVCLACWAAELLFGGNPMMAVIAVLVFSGIFATKVLVNAVKQVLKKLHTLAWLNRILTAAASFVIAAILMGGVISVGVRLTDLFPEEKLFPDKETPLYVSDLLETDYREYIVMGSPKQSLLLSYLKIEQRHGFDDEASPDIPEIEYEWIGVKAPWLYGFCENQMKRLILLSVSGKGTLEEQTSAPWGANTVYRLCPEREQEKTEYMLCFDDVLVRIGFNWEPTPEQMAVAGERLALK